MRTGAKLLIGCAGLSTLVIVLLAVALGAGVLFVGNKIQQFTGMFGLQRQASLTLVQLERKHRFRPPADGVVGEQRAQRFFTISDEVWSDVSELVSDMQQRNQRIRGGATPGVGDAVAAARGVGAMRTVLSDALERHAMPASEYLWTGLALARAHEHLDEPGDARVPEANLVLARRYRDRLSPAAAAQASGRANLNAILGAATMLAQIDGTALQFEGWDSLRHAAPAATR